MSRRDTMGDGTTVVLSTIVNCDARAGFLVDFNAKEYQNYKVVKFASIKDLDSYREKNARDVVQIESKTVDTGERRIFFGRSAKHLITTTVRSADEKSAGGEETIDGWYIEHETSDEKCVPDFVSTEPFYVIGTALVRFPEVARLHHTGPVPGGLAVMLTATHKMAGSKGSPDRILRTEETVEELSDSPLSPSLFELPIGFRENSHLLGSQPVSYH